MRCNRPHGERQGSRLKFEPSGAGLQLFEIHRPAVLLADLFEQHELPRRNLAGHAIQTQIEIRAAGAAGALNLTAHVRKQRLQIQRLMKVVGQHLQVEHLRFKARCAGRLLKCLHDGQEHVLAQTAFSLLARGHDFRKDPLVGLRGFTLAQRGRGEIAEQCHREGGEQTVQWM